MKLTQLELDWLNQSNFKENDILVHKFRNESDFAKNIVRKTIKFCRGKTIYLSEDIEDSIYTRLNNYKGIKNEN